MQFKCSTRSQDTKGQVTEAVSVLEVAAHKVRLERLHRGERVEPRVWGQADLSLNLCLATYYSKMTLGKSLNPLSSLICKMGIIIMAHVAVCRIM